MVGRKSAQTRVSRDNNRQYASLHAFSWKPKISCGGLSKKWLKKTFACPCANSEKKLGFVTFAYYTLEHQDLPLWSVIWMAAKEPSLFFAITSTPTASFFNQKVIPTRTPSPSPSLQLDGLSMTLLLLMTSIVASYRWKKRQLFGHWRLRKCHKSTTAKVLTHFMNLR